ncbi:hypothetical protein KC238_13345 [Mycobacteroides chelonae]|uniref:hypothetical protein n=1 Tax=Mycobacteroides chelonae TaxID=1774 RepID=UPI001C2C0635|nr:hypothetical protein [Mycobacteroides chelonae]MBV0918236.1 hypothetical protein [Mycobacteroides chelonae]UJW66073.1 hypothetical protein H0I67_01105 [Mycobacteroides chelonae]
MERKKPASAGQWIGSLMMFGGFVGAILSGQMAKNGSLAVGLFCIALAGLGIYLVSVVVPAAAAYREMNPRPAQPVVEDYPDDDDYDDTETSRGGLPVPQEKNVAASQGQATVPRRRGFLSGLGDGISLPHTNNR